MVDNKIGIVFKHLTLTMNELQEEKFMREIEDLLRRYAGVSWSYNYRIEDVD